MPFCAVSRDRRRAHDGLAAKTTGAGAGDYVTGARGVHMERRQQWVTAGVAKDIVEATWLALVDGFRLPLVLLGDRKHAVPESADSSWAV